MAALLACGPAAVLSHAERGCALGVIPYEPGLIHVSLPLHLARRRPGIHAHRRISVLADHVACRDRIPVTDVACTLVDLSARVRRPALERAVNEADRLDLRDPQALRDALVRLRLATRRPGRFASCWTVHVQAHGLLACAAPPPEDTARGGPRVARDWRVAERLEGRLLLAPARARRRDRRTALSPHPHPAGAGSRARPGPHRRRPDPAPLHPAQVKYEATARRKIKKGRRKFQIKGSRGQDPTNRSIHGVAA